MSRREVDPTDPPPTLEEMYECATATSNLGLPRGSGTGAQGILAAAAWNEVHMGTALMRLRTQWENARPHKRAPRPVPVLRAAGFSKEAAKRLHNRERVQFGLAFYEQKKALRMRIPEYQQALDQLTARAVALGIQEADTKAAAVLALWLDDPSAVPDAEGWPLRVYIADCLNRARAGLRNGMRGSTTNERSRMEES